MKLKVLAHLDTVTDAMLKKAKEGATAPLKLLWELGKLDENATSRRPKQEPSFTKLLMQELEGKNGKKQTAGE